MALNTLLLCRQCSKHWPAFLFQPKRNVTFYWCSPPKTVKAKPKEYKYSIVQPQKVSPVVEVPSHIIQPEYVHSGGQVDLRTIPESAEIKTTEQINGMKQACKLARNILNNINTLLKVGITTCAIDRFAHQVIIDHNAFPSPLGYRGFPKSICTSVNNVACHGIPDDRPLQDGDVINIDITVYYKGFHGDCSETFLIGNVDEAARTLVDVARQCRDEAIKICHDGQSFSEIGNTISDIVESNGFCIIPVFCGHGIGEYFHGPPDIIHVRNYNYGKMKTGMTFTIEPVVCEGSRHICILEDGWTAVTLDNSRSAQFEHTILITEDGAEILTI